MRDGSFVAALDPLDVVAGLYLLTREIGGIVAPSLGLPASGETEEQAGNGDSDVGVHHHHHPHGRQIIAHQIMM